MSWPILIVDDDEIMRKMIANSIKGDDYEIHMAANGNEALSKVTSVRPLLAILDVMMPDMDGYELCRRLRQMPVTANIPILILTSLTDIDERLKAFESGADDFILKPFQPAELRARLTVHLRRYLDILDKTTRPRTEAHRIAVFSLRGGVGVSTVATNLAVSFAQLWNLPTLLMDLALVNGQSALMLDLPMRNTWADLGRLKAEELDEETIQKVLLRHACGVDVLAAPKKIAEAELITADHVEQVLKQVEPKYHYIVMDMPHDFNATTLAALDHADLILLLFTPELAAIRCTANTLEVFRELGYPDEKIMLINNWTFESKGLARKEIESALKQPVKVVIPYVAEALVTAITLGKPVALEAQTSAIGALFEDLAFLWSKEEHKANPPETPSPALLRVRERAKRRQMQQAKS